MNMFWICHVRAAWHPIPFKYMPKSVDSIKCMGYNKKHKGRDDNNGRECSKTDCKGQCIYEFIW